MFIFTFKLNYIPEKEKKNQRPRVSEGGLSDDV
jgi:hypothetical protein